LAAPALSAGPQWRARPLPENNPGRKGRKGIFPMLKKVLFVLILALQAAAVTNVASADWPWPLCAPCPKTSK
jgi:hypothetical protein